MTSDLLLLSVACAFCAGGISYMVIDLKRKAWAWFMTLLDGAAVNMKI